MNKFVLVTGGSRGIGAATSRHLAQEGYWVCINYLQDEEAALELVALIGSEGGEAIAVQADVSIEEDVQRLFETIDEIYGPITHLVNNAGIIMPQAKLLDMDATRINKVLNTNVTSCFLCCKEALKRMKEGCAIVNVSSMAAKLGSANEYIDYAASKGAIDSLTIGLAKEVAHLNIRVNAVRPGLIYTDIHKSAGEENRVERLKDSVPLKRGGEPYEVASAIAYLLSEEASYSTGIFIDVSGGR